MSAPSITRLLVANRGEIAVRIARSAADLGIGTVGVFSTDDAASLHCDVVDRAIGLEAAGAAAYLDAHGRLVEARSPAAATLAAAQRAAAQAAVG